MLRWHHPKRGVVPPSEFIPLAEQNGMIGEIGEWALREACREAATWAAPLAGRREPFSGAVPLRRSGRPRARDPLGHGAAGGRLELEITEGVIFDDPSRALSILRRLKALGVKIAMDDFGTGYASMSSLQSFPFDKIKIDQSFVAGVDANPQSAAIVRSIIGLGNALDIPVIAEGVETEGERTFLRREGCAEIQGFLIGARPHRDVRRADLGSRCRRTRDGQLAGSDLLLPLPAFPVDFIRLLADHHSLVEEA